MMRTVRFSSPALASIFAAAIATGGLPAQIQKGTAAPEFQFENTWNDAPVSFAELKGKVILLEFFATW